MIGLPDGRIEEVTMVGDIILNPNIIPKGVLHIPAFQYNLLSVGKLLDTSNLATHFTKSGCVFQDLITKVKVADAHRLGGLYKLNKDFAGKDAKSKSMDNKSLHGPLLCNSASKHADMELRHARLGHCSLSKLKYVPGCTGSPDSIFCDTCMMSKFHRLPFQRSNSLASKSFELVHMDLWGVLIRLLTYQELIIFLLFWMTTLELLGPFSCITNCKLYFTSNVSLLMS